MDIRNKVDLHNYLLAYPNFRSYVEPFDYNDVDASGFVRNGRISVDETVKNLVNLILTGYESQPSDIDVIAKLESGLRREFYDVLYAIINGKHISVEIIDDLASRNDVIRSLFDRYLVQSQDTKLLSLRLNITHDDSAYLYEIIKDRALLNAYYAYMRNDLLYANDYNLLPLLFKQLFEPYQAYYKPQHRSVKFDIVVQSIEQRFNI